jgi:cytochrome c oxidase cbb3-type subunit 3
MYKETLRAIAGIGLFPALSLVLFIIVFTVVLVRVFRMDRAETEHLASLPLEPADGLVPARQEACR